MATKIKKKKFSWKLLCTEMVLLSTKEQFSITVKLDNCQNFLPLSLHVFQASKSYQDLQKSSYTLSKQALSSSQTEQKSAVKIVQTLVPIV